MEIGAMNEDGRVAVVTGAAQGVARPWRNGWPLKAWDA
jgi:hypothetical protein